MAEFPSNPQRLDPYKNFKFRLKWDGKYIAAVSRVSGLGRISEVVSFRQGGDPSSSHKAPGRTEYEPITLERGLTDDPAFEAWANLVFQFGTGLGSEMALGGFRKDIQIEFYNEAGQLVKIYNVYRCWPSEYYALPELDANATAVAVERLVLQNEGWERDTSVTEPVEPKTD